MITCYLRYDLDQVDAFEAYAQIWIPLVERFGGTHHGAAYEIYRQASASDPDCQRAYALAKTTKCVCRYERQVLRPVGTPAQSSEM